MFNSKLFSDVAWNHRGSSIETVEFDSKLETVRGFYSYAYFKVLLAGIIYS